MTGMESFNMGNKRGGQNMPMSSTQDSTQHTITTNKSSMCKFCNNLNFVQRQFCRIKIKISLESKTNRKERAQHRLGSIRKRRRSMRFMPLQVKLWHPLGKTSRINNRIRMLFFRISISLLLIMDRSLLTLSNSLNCRTK